jgi:hypothetical protein
MSDGPTPEDICRTILYNIDRAMELPSTQEDGIVVFHDLKNASKANVHSGVANLLLKVIILIILSMYYCTVLNVDDISN